MTALLIAAAVSAAGVNNRPAIGIMAQPADASLPGTQYIVASYVKWIESSGARVVPILFNQSQEELTSLFNEISGIVFPGGHVGTHYTPYGNASWTMMQMAQEANDKGDVFPIWGTCMGFQQLMQYGSGQVEPSVLHSTPGTEGLIVPLNFTDFGISNSRLVGSAPQSVKDALRQLPITINLHHYSVMTDQVERNGSKMHDFFSVIANSFDSSGGKFVSLVEARDYPFYGSQFHGEKNAFEWNQGWEHNVSSAEAHSGEAVKAMQHLSDFFVSEARRSSHIWQDDQPPAKLIYEYNPVKTSGSTSEKWDLCYVF